MAFADNSDVFGCVQCVRSSRSSAATTPKELRTSTIPGTNVPPTTKKSRALAIRRSSSSQNMRGGRTAPPSACARTCCSREFWRKSCGFFAPSDSASWRRRQRNAEGGRSFRGFRTPCASTRSRRRKSRLCPGTVCRFKLCIISVLIGWWSCSGADPGICKRGSGPSYFLPLPFFSSFSPLSPLRNRAPFTS